MTNEERIMKKTSWKSPMLLLLTAMIWGVAFVAQSVGMDYVGGFTFNCIRSLIGGLVLIPCICFLDKWKGKDKKEKTEEDPRALRRGGVSCGAALFIASNLQQFGIKYTSVGKAGFITAMYIILVPIAGIFLKKRAGAKTWFSVFLAVAGLYLLCITEGFSIGLGDVLVLLSALVFTVHILVIDYFSSRTDCVRMSCIQFFVCGILSGAAMLIFETPNISAVLRAWMPILYAGVMSCGVAYTLQIVGQKDTEPTIASLILSLESVVSVLAGWVLLGEKLSAREVTGCILMFTAIILAQLPKSFLHQTRDNISEGVSRFKRAER